MTYFLVVSEGCKMKKENQENSNSYSMVFGTIKIVIKDGTLEQCTNF